MELQEIINYMMSLDGETFDRFLELYKTYSALPESDRKAFRRRVGPIGGSLLREIEMGEMIHRARIMQDYKEMDLEIDGEEWGGLLMTALRNEKKWTDPNYHPEETDIDDYLPDDVDDDPIW